MAWLRQLTTQQQIWLLIATATVLRLLFSQLGLGVDESYTVATSRDFHLSLYDHPPMAWWLATLAQRLFGTAEAWAVRLPFVLLSAIATWQMFRLSSLLFSARAGIYAALAFSCAPVLGITTGSWVLPDGPLLVSLLGGAICLAHLMFDSKPDGRWWIAAGFCGGLALLSKYHGIFFFFGAALFVVSNKPIDWLKMVLKADLGSVAPPLGGSQNALGHFGGGLESDKNSKDSAKCIEIPPAKGGATVPSRTACDTKWVSQFHWLRSPWPYLGALVGLALFSPVILWNIDHHFASFAFQSGRTGTSHFYPLKPLQTLLGQALFLTPWIWLGLVVATREAWVLGMADSKRWLLLCLALPTIAVFTLISTISSAPILYHWAMPGYLLLFPLLGDWLAHRAITHARWVTRWVVGTCSLMTVLIAAATLLWVAPAQLQQWGLPGDPLAQIRPMDDDVAAYLARLAPITGADAILAPTKWHSAGRFDMALKGQRQVTCFCRDAREYGIIAPLSGMVGRNFIIPVPRKNADEMFATLAPSFAHLQRLEDLTIYQGGSTTETFAMFYGEFLLPDATVP